jgi:hypothetical protein
LDAYFESVDAAGPCAANETVCADVVRAQLQPFLQLIVFLLTQNPHEELHATVVDFNGAMCVSHFAIIAAAGARTPAARVCMSVFASRVPSLLNQSCDRNQLLAYDESVGAAALCASR